MREILRTFLVSQALAATLALAQTKPTFEVASVKPSAPVDMARVVTAMRSGEMPKIGAHFFGARVEYTHMVLQELIVQAYGVKPYQITGPNWISDQPFDIVAKVPEGTTKDEIPRLLQTLLEERFKLAVHREIQERPVLALIVSRTGLKMKASPLTPVSIDDGVPLGPGEMSVDTDEGRVRMTVGKDGSVRVNMGAKGIVSYKVDAANRAVHMEASTVRMSGFAAMLSQFLALGGGGRQVVDMTDLSASYQVALDFSLADRMNVVGEAEVGVSTTARELTPVDAASDPNVPSVLYKALQALGLKLEQRRAFVEQLVVDHLERNPTAN